MTKEEYKQLLTQYIAMWHEKRVSHEARQITSINYNALDSAAELLKTVHEKSKKALNGSKGPDNHKIAVSVARAILQEGDSFFQINDPDKTYPSAEYNNLIAKMKKDFAKTAFCSFLSTSQEKIESDPSVDNGFVAYIDSLQDTQFLSASFTAFLVEKMFPED
jgi:hypothetical protein